MCEDDPDYLHHSVNMGVVEGELEREVGFGVEVFVSVIERELQSLIASTLNM